ncbi:MAG: hypothetical protein IJI37_07615, partial [Opitutales bacterium]|nr:hypothetical protein [Opitutales bacterium]
MGKNIGRTLGFFAACAALCGCASGGAQGGAFVRVSKDNPNYTELSDGSPYVAMGYNLAFPRYWDKLSEDECFEMIETHLRGISENGGNYIRVWLSHP